MHWIKDIKLLSDIVNNINLAQSKENPVDACKNLYNSFNSLYQAFYEYRLENDLLSEAEIKHIERQKEGTQTLRPSEVQSFSELLLQGLDSESHFSISSSRAFSILANFTPPIMEDRILEVNRYNPDVITEELSKKASYRHRNFVKAYEREPRNINKLFRELASVLSVVRNNLAHYGKTPHGPDTNKSYRDTSVCRIIQPILILILEFIFESPNNKLGVYGTLLPGEVNHEILQNIKGEWTKGWVKGFIEEHEGLKYFTWNTESEDVEIDLLISESLQKEFSRIDQFEGKGYQKIWIPVEINNKYEVMNIYERKYSL